MLALVSLFSLFLSLVDFGFALKFNFTDVGQCEQIMISFNGPLTTRKTPTRVSIIPLNSNPIFIPFPNASLITTGLGLTFLPLSAGTNFLATLDDETGDNVINVSDLIRILPTARNKTDCLPAVTPPSPQQFKIVTPPRQCEAFAIEYDTSFVSGAPTVRLYSPKGPSFLLPVQADDIARGRATYNMNYPRGFEIVLVMDDEKGVRESTSLLTVQGDFASPKDCLFRGNVTDIDVGTTTPLTNGTVSTLKTNGPASPSKAVIIGSATAGGSIFIIAIGMTIFIVIDRRRRAQKTGQQNDSPSLIEKGPDANANAPARPRRLTMGLVATDPLYTTNFLSQAESVEKGDTDSWIQVTSGRRMTDDSLASTLPGGSRSVDRASFQSTDIERMLNMATLRSQISLSRKNATSFALDTPITLEEPYSAPASNERHKRKPSDVPADFGSDRSSADSLSNPFASEVSLVDPALFSRQRPKEELPISRAEPPGDKSNEGLEGGEKGDSSLVYGIAR